MKNSIQSLAWSRQSNNLNAIRLTLAILVILDHCFPLTTGQSDPLFSFSKSQADLGNLAVNLFFFISGLLITASWLNCRTMNDYLRRRVLRIFPGYLAALVFSFLAASIFAAQPLADLFNRLWNFTDICWLGFSSTYGDWVFTNNPFPGMANGSLYTIRREFGCYLAVAAIGLFGLFKRRVLILALFLLFFAFYSLALLDGTSAAHANGRFFTFFSAGMCVWLWRDKIPINNLLGLLALFLTVVTTQFSPFFNLLAPLTACYLVLWLGFAFRIKSLAWCDTTDLSYGVYLFAFPIQQMLAAAGTRNPWLMFALATPITIGIAFLSWNLLEKPCLKLKSKDFSDHDPGRSHPANPTPTPVATKVSW